MKKFILNAALIAMAIGITTGTTRAQETKTLAPSEQSSLAKTANRGVTILDGAWGIATDKAGNLTITDKNNTVIRMAEGAGTASVGEKGAINLSAANCPFSLLVDKTGNLHIIERIEPTDQHSTAATILPHETSNWGDPESARQTNSDNAMASKK